MNKITRPISPEDFEHYYSPVVVKLAYILSKKSKEEFSLLSYRSRVRWLNKARDISLELFNDKDVVPSLVSLARTLSERSGV